MASNSFSIFDISLNNLFKFNLVFIVYSVLIASTGFNFNALRAGMIDDKMAIIITILLHQKRS